MPHSSGAAAPVELRVESPDLHQLYKDLAAMEGNFRVALRKGIVGASKPMVDAAKANASWSRRIPGSIKAKASFSAKSAGVTIVADAKKAPHARAFENNGQAGTFRHPVYGHDVWVSQKARPFFYGSMNQAEAAKDIEAAIDQVVKSAGYSGS
jgi:hypothetical protein